MRKTKELEEFQRLLSDRLTSELPEHSSQVELRSICEEFFKAVDRIYKQRNVDTLNQMDIDREAAGT